MLRRSARLWSLCRRRFKLLNYNSKIYPAMKKVSYQNYDLLGEVPDHLSNLKLELEKTFASLEMKNEMLINAMSKNFGKTHQDLPNFKLPAVSNTSKKQTLFALPP